MPRSEISSFNESKTHQNRNNAKGNKNLRYEDYNFEKYVPSKMNCLRKSTP